MAPLKIGIALGSGSARGWSHIGVLKGLEELGIRPDIVAGASVGALVGAAYASEQLATLEDWVRGLTKMDVVRLIDTSLLAGGFMRGNRLMRVIAERIADRPIEELPITFAAVATDLDTGHEVWLKEGSMLAAARASSGLPGLFSPMRYQDRYLIDGGVVNPVPVSLCRALGADYVIAVNLNSHYSTRSGLQRRGGAQREEPREVEEESPSSALIEASEAEESSDVEPSLGNALLEKWSGLLDDFLDTRRSDKPREPGLFEVMATSINFMQDRITRSRMVGDPPAITIGPALGRFQLMDFHRGDEAIAIGYNAVQKVADEIKDLKDYLGVDEV
jgi:NTE family protein